jgi:hypothetical protein
MSSLVVLFMDLSLSTTASIALASAEVSLILISSFSVSPSPPLVSFPSASGSVRSLTVPFSLLPASIPPSGTGQLIEAGGMHWS